MAGHSHAANIRHKKDAMDKKRGKIFSKIARKLIVASRMGGPDIESNLPLKYAYELARAANMPKDVIQRNIDKGAGVGDDAKDFEEITYEGYGPGGVAILVDTLTDSRNRTAPEIRKLFERGAGNLGEPGCVAFLFDTRAVYILNPEGKSEDEIMEIVMTADADDMEAAGEFFVVTAEANQFIAVKKNLEEAGVALESSEISRLPKTEIDVSEEKQAEKILKLVEALEDHDDVQNVYANYSIDEELMAKVKAG